MRAVSPLRVRQRCREIATQAADQREVNERLLGACVGWINRYLLQYDARGHDVSDSNRRLVLAFLFAPEEQPIQEISSKDLTAGQKIALIRWVGLSTDERGKWLPRSTFEAEVNWVLNVALYLFVKSWLAEPPLSLRQALQDYCKEVGGKEDDLPADYCLRLAMELSDSIRRYEQLPLPAAEQVSTERILKELGY